MANTLIQKTKVSILFTSVIRQQSANSQDQWLQLQECLPTVGQGLAERSWLRLAGHSRTTTAKTVGRRLRSTVTWTELACSSSTVCQRVSMLAAANCKLLAAYSASHNFHKSQHKCTSYMANLRLVSLMDS